MLSLPQLGLPLKTQNNQNGAWYEQDTCDRFAEIAEYVYVNFDPSNDWHLRESAQDEAAKVIGVLKDHLDKVDSPWVCCSINF